MRPARSGLSSRSRRGNILAIVIVMLFVTMLMGLSLAQVAIQNLSSATESWTRQQSATAADAGIDYAVWFMATNDGTWPPPAPVAVDATPRSYAMTMPGSGASVNITVVAASGLWNQKQNVIITSAATLGPQTVTSQAIATPVGENVNAWNNALFSGVGISPGTSINGNMTIAGPVHILGTGIAPSTNVFNGMGTGGIFNTYENAGGPAFPGKLPPEPVTTSGAKTLNAKLRVKNGTVALSGTKSIGAANTAALKGSMDGIWVSGGTLTAPTIVADNGPPFPAYNLKNLVPFPDLASNWPGTSMAEIDYINTLSSAVYTGNLVITPGGGNVSIGPDAKGNSLIYNDATGVITINGLIKVTGTVSIGAHTTKLTFSGSGTILSGSNATAAGGILTGGQDITVDGSLSAVGTYTGPTGSGGFPNNVIAFLSSGNISMGPSAQARLQGAFFAEGTGTIGKQLQVDGTLVCQYYEFSNPPALNFVPDLPKHLPVGLPGATPITFISGMKIQTYEQY